MRADARRNRARILEVAFAAFAAEGLGVSVHEIARRAGVGTGTVSRHFPTKEELIEAVIVDRAGHLARQGEVLRAAHEDDPAAAFFGYFAMLTGELAIDKGLADALAGAGVDLEAVVAGSGHDVMGTLSGLLSRAQQAGAIRADVSLADVKALMTGCLPDDREATAGVLATGSPVAGSPAEAARRRRVEIVCAGLLARPTEYRVSSAPEAV